MEICTLVAATAPALRELSFVGREGMAGRLNGRHASCEGLTWTVQGGGAWLPSLPSSLRSPCAGSCGSPWSDLATEPARGSETADEPHLPGHLGGQPQDDHSEDEREGGNQVMMPACRLTSGRQQYKRHTSARSVILIALAAQIEPG
eukprot:1091300-Rhodomonas_salina.1